jgi:uncharacterized protein YukJ
MILVITESQYKRLLSEQFKNSQPPQNTQSGLGSLPSYNRAPYSQGNEGFREPLGNPQQFVKGKYKAILPPQNDDYYWDQNKETVSNQQFYDANGKIRNKNVYGKGAWVRKSFENVDQWRDVPSGYLPSEYDEALKFEKNKKKDISGRSNNYNPYYNKDYPLGISSTQKQLQDRMIQQRKQEEKNRQLQNYEYSKQHATIDTMIPQSEFQKRGVSNAQMMLNDINNIKKKFGEYKQKQKKDNFDWVDFGLLIASMIPVAAPYAAVFKTIIGLSKAINKFNQGKNYEAGLELIFAAFPALGKAVSQSDLINIGKSARVGSRNLLTAGKVLSDKSDDIFDMVSKYMVNAITSKETEITKFSQQLLKNVMSKTAEKAVPEMTGKGYLKSLVKPLDKKGEET